MSDTFSDDDFHAESHHEDVDPTPTATTPVDGDAIASVADERKDSAAVSSNSASTMHLSTTPNDSLRATPTPPGEEANEEDAKPKSASESATQREASSTTYAPTQQNTVTASQDDSTRQRQQQQHRDSNASEEPPVRRSTSNVKNSTTSRASADFGDDVEREKAHLRNANARLKDHMHRLQRQVDDAKGGADLPVDTQRALAEIEADNETVKRDIVKLRTKLVGVNNVEALDKLHDQIAGKRVDLKALELKIKTCTDENFFQQKLVKKELQKTPQEVYLELKEDRRRYQKRLEKATAALEKSQASAKLVTTRLRSLEEKDKQLGLPSGVSRADILQLRKRAEDNPKELEKLQRKAASFDSTQEVRKQVAARKCHGISDEVRELHAQVRAMEQQIGKLEQTIMSNRGLAQRPPHFLEKLNMPTPSSTPRNGTQPTSIGIPPTSPRPPLGNPPPRASARSSSTSSQTGHKMPTPPSPFDSKKSRHDPSPRNPLKNRLPPPATRPTKKATAVEQPLAERTSGGRRQSPRPEQQRKGDASPPPPVPAEEKAPLAQVAAVHKRTPTPSAGSAASSSPPRSPSVESIRTPTPTDAEDEAWKREVEEAQRRESERKSKEAAAAESTEEAIHDESVDDYSDNGFEDDEAEDDKDQVPAFLTDE